MHVIHDNQSIIYDGHSHRFLDDRHYPPDIQTQTLCSEEDLVKETSLGDYFLQDTFFVFQTVDNVYIETRQYLNKCYIYRKNNIIDG